MKEALLKPSRLVYGGIMVNYLCIAACRHCLYACSPTRKAGYMSVDMVRNVCALLRAGGCYSVHIGGGEPFLDFEGLIMVVQELNKAGISLEYIETNGYWSTEDSALEKLTRLRDKGVDTLCISLDPFHAEYVSYERPLHLAQKAKQVGMSYFVWKEQFLPVLSRLEAAKPHSRSEMETALSQTYIADAARLYGLYLGGRAVNIEQEYYPRRRIETLIDAVPCKRLFSGAHFHVDMYGFFIPPGCTGLRVPLEEVVAGIPSGKYPVFETLYRSGITSLLEYAQTYGFQEDAQGYPSKCNLCFHVRRYLASHNFAELDPMHYEESLKYY